MKRSLIVCIHPPENRLYFKIRKSNGKSKPLVNGGASKVVTFKNRLKFCNLYDEERLHEFDAQVDAIRRGLSCIVPFRSLQYLTPEELEICVCGDPEVDINFWKKNTKYTGSNFNANIHLQIAFGLRCKNCHSNKELHS